MWQAGEADPCIPLRNARQRYRTAVSRDGGTSNRKGGRANVVQRGSVVIAFTAYVSLGCAGFVPTRHPSGTRDGDFDNFVARYAVAKCSARYSSSETEPKMS